MAKFKNNSNSEVSEVSAIMAYFRQAGESVSQFNEQLKQLSAADKTELAIGAAKELGWTPVVE